jgi:hypothetical protein
MPMPCRYPVLVDPQGQGRIWIMNREEANQLKARGTAALQCKCLPLFTRHCAAPVPQVTQLNDRMFRNHMEVSGQGGQACGAVEALKKRVVVRKLWAGASWRRLRAGDHAAGLLVIWQALADREH